jgi:pimeloyl-ACP methyl ester carboxylesterase
MGKADRAFRDHFDVMGGMVAQEIVRQAPERVMRLVLYGTGPHGSIPGRFETIARSRERLAEDGVERTARRICATWLLDREASPAFEALVALAAGVSPQAAEAGLWAMEGWDGSERLSAIKQTTLIVWGEHDRSYGWTQVEALWRGIPAASLAWRRQQLARRALRPDPPGARLEQPRA